MEHAIQFSNDRNNYLPLVRFDLMNGTFGVYSYDGNSWTTLSAPGASLNPMSGTTSYLDFTIPINEIPILDLTGTGLWAMGLVLDSQGEYDLAPDNWAYASF